MSAYEAGDVVFVKASFVDSDREKDRPAVVVSTRGFCELTGLVLVAHIYSDPPPAERDAWPVETRKRAVRGWVTPDILFTKEAWMVRRLADKMEPTLLQKVLGRIHSNVAMPL